ncbi:nucleotide sugar dehydrogenase [Amphritea balenae]|uniref:UDP-glucose 6-dehydrogenase n=1 Tax=Amphritea balenae TaxID=452629 RepID=A0A3P1SSJ8_9GAMM|nr:nucleotide sugar dehydrogenase [Amphritea balenae]RRD00164.1 UDP-glucose/GDP-mannose dehydrogenase family protein [Amphritea balenae]GGK77200.1 UDP-glucose 6-dehydrogenase [Amphritea balenae]
MKIKVYGADLTAWVAAACLARSGNDVTIEGQNIPKDKPLYDISILRDEPGLLEQIQLQVKEGRLKRNSKTSDTADIYWLALEHGEYDQAQKLIVQLGEQTTENLLIINQCNFGVGASDQLQALLNEDANQAIVYIPNNLQEGQALQGFSQPKRIIIGSDNNWAITATRALIKPYLQNIEHLQIMSCREAEFTKFAITGMLAIRLGYINELANLADKLDVDIDTIRDGMGADPRVGSHYLSPGCGFGGQNFNQYIARFSEIFENKGHNSLLKTVITENEIQKELLFRKLWQHYQCDLTDKAVAIWGASFKPGTASIDNAPSLKIIDALLAQGVHVKVHDPEALNNLRQHYAQETRISFCDSAYSAAADCHALLLVTEWPEYWSPDYMRLLDQMHTPLIIDGRNVFDKEALEMYGFIYIGVGR